MREVIDENFDYEGRQKAVMEQMRSAYNRLPVTKTTPRAIFIKEMAKATGCSVRSVSYWLKGRNIEQPEAIIDAENFLKNYEVVASHVRRITNA